MGNIIGEGFDGVIKSQVEARQKVYGSTNRTNNQLRYMNANSAWIRMSSAVDVDSERASQIGQPGLVSNSLAKAYVLSGGAGLYGDKGFSFYSGLDAYQLGGGSQGFRPPPGIISMETKNRNRGSVRETNINIKCYNTEQFQIIDALYLRLGYTVLIEWGHSLFVDNGGNLIEMDDSYTLTGNFLNSAYANKLDKLNKDINAAKLKAYGNYDATYGKISNFSWDYGADGTYDIRVTILSLGEVIESLKVNTLSTGRTGTPPEKEEETDAGEAEDVDDNFFLFQNRNKNAITSFFFDIVTYLNLSSNTNSDDITSLSDSEATSLSLESGGDAVKFIEYTYLDEGRYYIRFGAFLKWLQKTKLIYLKDQEPIFNIDTDENNNLIYTTPSTLSADPRICIVKTNISTTEQDFAIFSGLPKDFKEEIDGSVVGKLMNVYLSLRHITKVMDETKGEDGSISLFDMVQKLCEGISTALGNTNQLSLSIDEADNNRVYIIDETQLPNREAILKKQGKSTNLTKFSIFGFKEGNASFILDFGIKTEVSKNLSTNIAIGAQADGQGVGEDATAFSKWNQGILDRIMPEKNSANPKEDKESDESTYTNIIEEFSNFCVQMVDRKFDESIDTFPDILKNYLTYLQAQDSAKKGSKDKKASTTVGFIPINLNLTMVGLSGIKIYQKFSVDTYFLPSNYPDTLDFLLKGITHKVEGNRWTTSIESLSIPSDKVSASPVRKKFPYRSAPVNQELSSSPIPSDPAASGANLKAAQNGLSGIQPGRCGQKFITYNFPPTIAPEDAKRKEALQKGYDAVFSNGQFVKGGRCARYTYNHAYNYSKAILGTGKLANGGSLPAGGNANQSSYFANLIKLGYTQTVIGKNITKRELIDLIENKLSYNLGDVLSYWANDNPSDSSASQYGHTQMYIGVNKIKVKQSTPKGWTTDRFTNYGSTFVYNGSSYNCWNLILFRAPYPGSEPQTDDKISKAESLKLYDKYVQEIQKVLSMKDLLYSGKQPLLERWSGGNDNEEGAVKDLKILFGEEKSTASYYNKYDISELHPDHITLFKKQFYNLLNAVINTDNYYKFLYPDKNNSKSFDEKTFILLSDVDF